MDLRSARNRSQERHDSLLKRVPAFLWPDIASDTPIGIESTPDETMKSTPHKQQGLSAAHIAWAYRLFLDREPESDQAIEEKLKQFRDTQTLRDEFLRSAEYRRSNPEIVRRTFAGSEPRMEVEDACSQRELSELFVRQKESWHELGKHEPFWSMLVCDRYRTRNIAETVDEFFETGHHSATLLKATLERNGCDLSALKEALEFGCGVGRVTRWLAKDGLRVNACDISRPHLEIAQKHAKAEWAQRIKWRCIRSLRDYSCLPKVDLGYSIIALQHNPPPLAAFAIGAILKSLRPGGVAVFQIPTYKSDYRFTTADYLSRHVANGLEMGYSRNLVGKTGKRPL
jgi:2-polyprenyl-3-methyl-5-hydroxy-6-metoxy-1,4-benzoquinol methylase